MDKQKWVKKIDKIVEPLSKIGGQRHVTALRDGFALALPFTIAGAMAILFITIVFGGWGAEKTSIFGLLAHASGQTVTNYGHLFDSATNWKMVGGFAKVAAYGQNLFSWVNSATLGMISVYVAFFIGYSMGIIKRSESPILTGAFALATYFVLTGANKDLFGAQGTLIALIAGLAGSEFYTAIVKSKKLELKLPSSVPPAVGKAFGVLLPGFVSVTCFGIINILCSLTYIGLEGGNASNLLTLSTIINDVILQPFMIFARSGGDIAILEVYLFFAAFLFFFGIHGPNTLGGAIGPIGILLWVDNMSGGSNVAMEQVWSGFGIFGGTGGTLMLVILSLVFLSKGSPTREVAKFALPSGIFEINEPVIFGYPIMYNVTYFIPFILAGPISVIWPIIAIKTGLMNAPTLLAPWTTPPILYGLIVTQFDYRSVFVSLLVLVTQFFIWLPFVLLQRKQDSKELNIKENKKDLKAFFSKRNALKKVVKND